MAALLRPPIFVGLPPKGPRTPPGTLFCAGWVCWHPETLGAHAATKGTVVSSEAGNNFGHFLAFFACSGRFGKNGDFWAAQPPKRSFDRPVRWYLGYLRARDAQSATLPLVYVTSGGSNLPVRPKKAPPSAQTAIAKRVVSNARSAIFGVCVCFPGPWDYTHRSLFRVDQNPEPHARPPPKTADLPKKKPKKIARRNRTNDHQTATTDNHGQ